MTTHVLPMNRTTLHGHFNNALPPALRIASGDSVRFSLWDASWRHHPTEGIRELDFRLAHALLGPAPCEGPREILVVDLEDDLPVVAAVADDHARANANCPRCASSSSTGSTSPYFASMS